MLPGKIGKAVSLLKTFTTSRAKQMCFPAVGFLLNDSSVIVSIFVGFMAFLLYALSIAKKRNAQKQRGEDVQSVPFKWYGLIFLVTSGATYFLISRYFNLKAGGGGGGGSHSQSGGVPGCNMIEDVMTFIDPNDPPF